MDIFLIPETAPFAISAFIFLGLFAIEVILLVFGASFSGAIDDMLPDLDLDGTDFSVGKAFSFVGFGRVPTLVLLMIFTLSFAAVGFGLQQALQGMLGAVAPTWLAVLLTMPVSLLVTGWASGLVAKIVPNVQTSAVSEATLIGRAATITYGTATRALPAAAEVRDDVLF
jgi:hypothetical protein